MDVSGFSAPPKGFIESKIISDFGFDSRQKDIQTPCNIKCLFLILGSDIMSLTILNKYQLR